MRQIASYAPEENHFTSVEQARRVYYGAIFGVKKEIPTQNPGATR
jgi:hypothetical protein